MTTRINSGMQKSVESLSVVEWAEPLTTWVMRLMNDKKNVQLVIPEVQKQFHPSFQLLRHQFILYYSSTSFRISFR